MGDVRPAQFPPRGSMEQPRHRADGDGTVRRHDREQFQVFCYSDTLIKDEVTAHLRERAHQWLDTASLSDAELAEKIRADRMDILIDLSQHMANNRLLVVARKPAPVQATHLGY